MSPSPLFRESRTALTHRPSRRHNGSVVDGTDDALKKALSSSEQPEKPKAAPKKGEKEEEPTGMAAYTKGSAGITTK